MNLSEVDRGWEDWEELIANEMFTVRYIPIEFVILKDQMYPMNYVLVNLKTRRPEVLLPSEIAAISTIKGLTEAMAAESNETAMVGIMKGILDS